MPSTQTPKTGGSIQRTQQHVQSSRSSSFAEANSSSSCPGSPLEAFGDIPPLQKPCILRHTSTSVDSLARARIIAVLALNIFVYDTPLNAHRDRWICPFSNCKQSFLDPKTMMSHAANCTHVSANGAYCNCCCCYYDFHGQSPACLARAGDSAPPIAKDSAMTKGRRIVHEFLSRRSGSASSSREQPPSIECSTFTMGSVTDSPLASRKGSTVSDFSTTGLPEVHQPREEAAALYNGPTSKMCNDPISKICDDQIFEICDDQIFEICDDRGFEMGNSNFLPSPSELPSSMDSHVPQRLTRSSVPKMSTTDYVELEVLENGGDLCMLPTEYSATDIDFSTTQQPCSNSALCDAGGFVFNFNQEPQDAGQDLILNVDIGQVEAEEFTFDQFVMPSQESQEPMSHVPNFSRPRHSLSYGQSGETSPAVTNSLNRPEDIVPMAPIDSQHSHGGPIAMLGLPPAEHSHFYVGIAHSNPQQSEVLDAQWMTISWQATPSPGSLDLHQGDATAMRCPEPEFNYQPRGEQANWKANLKKHRKTHGQRILLICQRCGSEHTRSDNLLAHQRDVCGKGKTRQRRVSHRPRPRRRSACTRENRVLHD